jgi:hypothetical protein
VVIHVRQFLKALLQQFLSFLCPQPVLKEENPGYDAGEHVAEEHDPDARNTFPHQKSIKAKTYGRHNNYKNQDRKNVPLVWFQHGTGDTPRVEIEK